MNKIKSMLMALMILSALSGVVAIYQPSSVYADSKTGCSTDNVLGFPAWYHGLTKSNSCELKDISSNPSGEQVSLQTFVIKIVMNVIEIILRLVGYAAVIMIIIGGFQYMTSAGDQNMMANAKKTITNSIIGLVVSLMSVAIVSLVAGAL